MKKYKETAETCVLIPYFLECSILKTIINIKLIFFTFSFLVLNSGCNGCFTPGVNFYLEAKCSLETPNLYLEFIKFTIAKVDSHIQVISKFFFNIIKYKF